MLGVLIWCGLVGKFVASVVSQAVDHQRIQTRSQETPANVISSRILQQEGRGGKVFTAQIRYQYNVKGRDYTSNQYSYAADWTSNYQFVRQLADAYPAGETIKVFYDPQDPAQAAINLQMPSRLYFLMLFSQPMIAIGVIGFFVSMGHFISQARRHTFLNQDMLVPCYIPSWGLLRNEMGGYAIGQNPNLAAPAKAMLAAYGLACFIGIFALGMKFRTHGLIGQASSIKAAFGISGAIGIGVGVARLLTQKSPARLHLDTGLGKLSLKGPNRQANLNFKDIASWTLKQVANPRPVKSETDMPNAPLLGDHTFSGRDIPTHIFEATGDGFKIANKTGQALARITGRPFSRSARAPQTSEEPIDLAEARELAIEQTRKARRLWDLT